MWRNRRVTAMRREASRPPKSGSVALYDVRHDCIYYTHHILSSDGWIPRRPMKVSREQAAQNRERILDAAARLFRERGLEGIGVADTMKAAGLTHGGFYGHFSSKEDLIAQACARAFSRSHERWSKMVGRTPDDPLSSIVRSYLSRGHRDDPGTGCTLAALGPDIARHDSGVRRAVAEGLRSAFNLLSGLVPS